MDIITCWIQDQVLRFPLLKEGCIYQGGSLPDNQIFLPFQGISRRHFRIYREGGQLIYQDLRSKNGSFVEGKRINQVNLQAIKGVRLGPIMLAYTKDDERMDVHHPLKKLKDQRAYRSFQATREGDFTDMENMEDLFFLPHLSIPEGVILGASWKMFPVYQKLSYVAGLDEPVLLYGETGTGKEVIAQILSRTHEGPFIAINGGAIVRGELTETELFGIEDGVATKVRKRMGLISKAHEGVFFLDEIESMPLDQQGKLLRVIEDKTVLTVGGRRQKVNFQLIAATNQPPEKLFQEGRLREDLYYRLCRCFIQLPPLRERKEDLDRFIALFFKEACQAQGKKVLGITKKAMEMLHGYPYPGNIRELKNIIFQGVSQVPPDALVDVEHLPEGVVQKGLHNGLDKGIWQIVKDYDGKLPLKNLLDDVARQAIKIALETHHGNLTRAAEFLGLSRRGLQKMLKRLYPEGGDNIPLK